MDKQLDEIFDEFNKKFNKLYNERSMDSKYMNLTLSQVEYLETIRMHYKIQLSDLASEIGVTKASASVMVKKLIDLKLLVKEQAMNDKRVSYISLTKEALDFLELDRIVYKEMIYDALNQLTEEEGNTLLSIISKIK